MKSLLLALMLASTGCVGYEPDVGKLHGEPVAGDAGIDSVPMIDGGFVSPGCNRDSDPAVTVSFALHIRPLMTKSPGGCIPCHLGRITSGLDLSSYQSLRRGGLHSGTRLVVPFEPCNSILPKKLGPTPPFGVRMPYNGPPYYSVAERQLVHDWIAEGALNN